MIRLDESGLPTRVVRAKVVTEVEFLAGGQDDVEATGAVARFFDDHYDEIADNAFLRDGIVSMTMCDIKCEEGKV